MSQSSLPAASPPQASPPPDQPVPSQHAAEQVEPEQAALQGIPAPKPKHFHYTPELKLQLIHLCIGNGDQYLEEPQEDPFWQYITAIFQQTSGHQGACARKKVTAMVAERKSTLEARDMLSGVAIPPVTDLEQAIDAWIEICERRLETLESTKSEASAETKKEKAISEMLRDNLTKRLSNKRRFQAIVEAREVVDLTAPGDVIPKRRHIRQNLRASKSINDSKEKMRQDFSKLTEVFIDYMSNFKAGTPQSGSSKASESSSPADPQCSSSTGPQSSSSAASELAIDVAKLETRMSSLEANQDSIKQFLQQLVKDKEQSS